MLILVYVDYTKTCELYNEVNSSVCISLIKKLSKQSDIWCEHMYNIFKQYPKIILHSAHHDYSTVYLFKDDTCLDFEYLRDDDLIANLNVYKDEFLILDDIASRDQVLVTVDLYHAENYLEYEQIKPDLRKIMIDEFLNSL